MAETQYGLDLQGETSWRSSSARIWLLAFVGGHQPPDLGRWLARDPRFLSSATGERLVQVDDILAVYDSAAKRMRFALPSGVAVPSFPGLMSTVAAGLEQARGAIDTTQELVAITLRGGRIKCAPPRGSKRVMSILDVLARDRPDPHLSAFCRHALASYPRSDDVFRAILHRTLGRMEGEDPVSREAAARRARSALGRAYVDRFPRAAADVVRQLAPQLQSDLLDPTASPGGRMNQVGFDGYLLVGKRFELQLQSSRTRRSNGHVLLHETASSSDFPDIFDVRTSRPNLLAAKASVIDRRGDTAKLQVCIDDELRLSLGHRRAGPREVGWPVLVWVESPDIVGNLSARRTLVAEDAVFSIDTQGKNRIEARVYFLPDGLDLCHVSITVDMARIPQS